MKNSLKMTRLDYFTMKHQMILHAATLIGMILIYTFMLKSSIVLLGTTCSWITALFSSTIFVTQEKNQLNCLYATVSIRPAEIVRGRYQYLYLNYLAALLVCILFSAANSLLNGIPVSLTDILTTISLSFFIYSCIMGMQIPIYYKMGYARAKYWSMIPYLFVLSLVYTPAIVKSLSYILVFLQLHLYLFMIIGVIAGVAISFLSCRISVCIYKKNRV